MSELRGRALMDSRYGPLFDGRQSLTVAGTDYDVAALMFRMGLNFDDSRVIDAVEVECGRYAVRYYDGEDQRVVAHEFDADFRFLGETRAHIAEWIGEDGYFEWFGRLQVRCPADL